MKMKIAERKGMLIGIVLGLMLLLAGGSILHAGFMGHRGPGGHDPEEHVGWIRYQLTQKLDLDASQQQELEAITQELLKKGKALHQLRNKSRQEMLSVLRADSVDGQRIEQLAAQHREQVGEFITEAGSHLAEFVNILTPRQRKQLAKMIEEHAGHSHLH
jgi:Spy/CpxP family protein refolding chaperone